MVLEEVANLSEFVSIFPVEISDSILKFLLVLKTLGVITILYFLYVIGMGILTYRKTRRLVHVEKKINNIEKKIDLVNKKLNKLIKKS